MMLARRVDGDAVRPVVALLADLGIDEPEARELAAGRGLMTLGDVGQPVDAAPVAALAVRLGPDGRAASVVGVIVAETMRRRGLARRLVVDTVALLRSEGCRSVDCWVDAGEPVDCLLRSVGFLVDDEPAGDEDRAGGRARHLVVEL